ncbi:MAG TPA: serine/threonine-protein kinase [Bryobacteraceae bacterium]
MAFSIGETVGDYRIVSAIGSGGMGTVYKAQHLISERLEAIKVVLPDLVDSPELADRFIREIKVQARLNHPNITALHNAFRLENQLLMVMEFVEGTTLHSRLKSGRLEAGPAIDVVLQVLSALRYAHAQGVVHRDIKPANIMLTANGIVKLMDFGIARSLADKQLTNAGAAIGSVYYMSPEQVQGTGVGARSDLYSVGIMLYEMVTGARPIEGESSWAVMNAHLNQPPRSPAVLNSGLPASLCLAILKALEKDPANRYQNAAEMASILETLRQRHAGALGAVTETIIRPPQGYDPGSRLATPTPHTPVTRTPLPTPSPTPPSRFDLDELDSVKQDLAAFLGPVARVLVDRTAKKAASWKQLYEMLASELETPEERKKFLATRRR